MKHKLIDNPFDDEHGIDLELINGEIITKIIDQIIELIQERVMTLGAIDARSNSPVNNPCGVSV